MATTRPLISAVKSVMLCVQDLAAARAFYEGCLGLHCIAEADTLSDKTRRLWGLNDRNLKCVRLAKPGDKFGMVDLIERGAEAAVPIRNPERPWDYGWLSLNFRTTDIERALRTVAEYGAQALSAPLDYEAGGKHIREAMIKLASGEHCTLLQAGPAVPDAPLFGEAVATVGAVVPSLEKSLAFYRDALGLSVAVTIAHSGPPFSHLLGAPERTRLEMALLTAGGMWTGKLEFLQLTVPGGEPKDTNVNANGHHRGFWMMSVMCQDMDDLLTACRRAGVTVVRGPAAIDRPCYGRVKAAIIRAPGGELLECLAPVTAGV